MWEAQSQQGPGRCSSLLIVAELGAHRQTAAPDLLHLQLGSHIRVVGQTQRVKLLATRAHQIKVMSTEWTTVHTLSLDGTHQDKLAGQRGKEGLGAHQHGRIHVVQAIKLEDHGTSLEPHTFAGTIVDSSVLLQQLRGQAPEYAQRPCSTSGPFITTGLLPGCGASGGRRSPTPDRPPLGRAAGARHPLAVGAGGVGVGTRHQPHSVRSCEPAVRAVGRHNSAPGGKSVACAWGIRSWALSHARPPDFGACGRGPLPTGCGCGQCGREDPSPTAQRALLGAGFARCGGGTRAHGPGAPLAWVSGVPAWALSHMLGLYLG